MHDRWAIESVDYNELERVASAVWPENEVSRRIFVDLFHENRVSHGMLNVIVMDSVPACRSENFHDQKNRTTEPFQGQSAPAYRGLMIGYARVSTDSQDLTSQREALLAIGVTAERIYVDHGLTGANRARPGLREALAACRSGDMLVVTKLDRLARSLPDARDIRRRTDRPPGQAQPRRLRP